MRGKRLVGRVVAQHGVAVVVGGMRAVRVRVRMQVLGRSCRLLLVRGRQLVMHVLHTGRSRRARSLVGVVVVMVVVDQALQATEVSEGSGGRCRRAESCVHGQAGPAHAQHVHVDDDGDDVVRAHFSTLLAIGD